MTEEEEEQLINELSDLQIALEERADWINRRIAEVEEALQPIHVVSDDKPLAIAMGGGVVWAHWRHNTWGLVIYRRNGEGWVLLRDASLAERSKAVKELPNVIRRVHKRMRALLEESEQ